jgi:hypothetical protein
MPNAESPSEHHLRFHRRQWIIYLLGCTTMAVGTIVMVLAPGMNSAVVRVPILALFGLLILLSVVERVMRRAEYVRERQRILADEWTRQGMNRSLSIAMRTMIFAQPFLAFFMAYVPPKPSIAGMSSMTVALGCGIWAAAYLYHTRPSPDE